MVTIPHRLAIGIGFIIQVGLANLTCAAPEGDQMGDPALVSGPTWVTTLDLTEATAELDEPAHGQQFDFDRNRWVGVPPSRSVWLRWIPPRDGRIALVTRTTQSASDRQRFDGALYRAAYTNTPTGGLVQVARGTPHYWLAEMLLIDVIEGRPYLMAIDAHGAAVGAFDVGLTYVDSEPPANDHWSAALELGTEPLVFDLNGATREPEDPDYGTYVRIFNGNRCLDTEQLQRGGNSVWFRWTAPATGTFTVLAALPKSFPQMTIFRDQGPPELPPTFSQLVEVSRRINGDIPIKYYGTPESFPCSEPVAGTVEGQNSMFHGLRVQAGERYVIQIDQMIHAQTEPFYIPPGYDIAGVPADNSAGLIRIDPPVSNDDVEGAARLEPMQWSRARGGSTLEPGEERLPVPTRESSCWWEFTAERDEHIAILPMDAELFVGTRIVDLIRLAPEQIRSNEDFHTYSVKAGTRYLLRVAAGVGQEVAAYYQRPDSADEFERAAEMQVTPLRVSARVEAALLTWDPREPRRPNSSATGIGWVAWRPSVSGRIRVSGPSSFAFFRGTNVNQLALKEPGWMTGQNSVDFYAGEEIRIALETEPSYLGHAKVIVLDAIAQNDSFESPIRLGVGEEIVLPKIYGTSQEGEPAHSGRAAHASIWYEWTCPVSGAYSLIADGPDRPRVALYSGGNLSSLTPVVQLEPTAGGGRMGAIHATAGERFRIAVEPGGPEQPSVRFIITATAPFDSFASSRPVGSAVVTVKAGPASREEIDEVLLTPEGYSTVWLSYNRFTPLDPKVLQVRVNPRDIWLPRRSPMIRLFGGPDSEHLVLTGESAPIVPSGPLVAEALHDTNRTTYIQLCIPAEELLFADLSVRLDPPRTLPGEDSIQMEAWPDRLRLRAPSDTVLRLEQSTDLVQWRSWGDCILINGNLDVPLDGSAGPVSGYFRARAY